MTKSALAPTIYDQENPLEHVPAAPYLVHPEKERSILGATVFDRQNPLDYIPYAPDLKPRHTGRVVLTFPELRGSRLTGPELLGGALIWLVRE